MAKAMKCDRCGSYYDPISEFRKVQVLCLSPEKRVDLCKECYKDLEKFLRVKEEEENATL